LIALDVFPDAARSVLNVTADITVATVLTRDERTDLHPGMGAQSAFRVRP